MLYRTKQGGLLLLVENEYFPCTFEHGVPVMADVPLKEHPEIIGVVTIDMAKQMYTSETVENVEPKPVGRRRKLDV